MSIRALIQIFKDTYEAHFDDVYDGEHEDLVNAIRFADEDWTDDALMDAFANAGVAGCEDWPEEFWADLSSAFAES